MTPITPIVHLVQTTSRYQTPLPHRMPGAAWTVFTTLHKLHQCWRWFRKAEIYTNSQNFQQLITGHVVNWIVGDKLVVRVAAQCILISTRILACVEQQIALHQAYQKWIHAIKGTHPSQHYDGWKVKHSTSILSPSTSNWWNEKTLASTTRIKRIAAYSLELNAALFKLSMCLMDAIEAFSLNPNTQNESINEMFVNSDYCLERVVENKEFILHGLNQNKQLVQTILTGLQTSYTVEQLIQSVSRALGTAEKVQHVAQVSGGMTKELTKRTLFGLFSGAGMDKYFPFTLSAL